MMASAFSNSPSCISWMKAGISMPTGQPVNASRLLALKTSFSFGDGHFRSQAQGNLVKNFGSSPSVPGVGIDCLGISIRSFFVSSRPIS